jgi:hypothetical protein
MASLAETETRKMNIQHQIERLLRKTVLRTNFSGNMGFGGSVFLYYFGNDSKVRDLFVWFVCFRLFVCYLFIYLFIYFLFLFI